jgi:hypothetical protein
MNRSNRLFRSCFRLAHNLAQAAAFALAANERWQNADNCKDYKCEDRRDVPAS